MQRIIKQVAPTATVLPTHKRVAAYARVSSSKDAMLHSLSTQVSYYSGLIQSNPQWEYAGVYADEGISGTKANRPQLQQLLTDCRNGKVDLVITKSISRFARNTLTLLEIARELKTLGVDIYFEEQNIHTISGEGEFMLTLLASFAQEESYSVSENCKWRIRNDFAQGKCWSLQMLGYRRTPDGTLEIEPTEAEVVRMIFADYLGGMGKQAIANKLTELGVPTRCGTVWHPTPVQRILQNEKYTGNLLLQKKYRENHLSKKTLLNLGHLRQYLVTDSHDAIVDEATFQAVQAELARRAKKATTVAPTKSMFTGNIHCGGCGKHYRRKTTASGIVWICPTYNSKGKKHCPTAKQIPEETLLQVTKTTCPDMQMLDHISVPSPNILIYHLTDGTCQTATWQDRSRSESWTPQMRHAVGETVKARNALCQEP